MGKREKRKKLVEADVGEEEVYYILYQSIFSR
jgi:hypothetical protein